MFIAKTSRVSRVFESHDAYSRTNYIVVFMAASSIIALVCE